MMIAPSAEDMAASSAAQSRSCSRFAMTIYVWSALIPNADRPPPKRSPRSWASLASDPTKTVLSANRAA